MNSQSGEPASDARLHEISTCWSDIRRLQNSSPNEAHKALHQLVTRYSLPLQRYLQGPQWRFDSSAADDLVQGFIQTKFLSGNLLSRSNENRGRFRSLLKTAIDNYVCDQLRSPGHTPLAHARGTAVDSRSDYQFTAADSDSDLDPFDIAWAREIIQSIIVQMRVFCHQTDQLPAWRVFEARLLNPILHGNEPLPYEVIADTGDFDSPKAAANALVTAKRIFRRMFDQAVRDYANDDEELGHEVQLIRSIFARGICLVEPTGRHDDVPINSAKGSPGDDDSWLLARVLDLPHAQPVWTAFELEAILDHQLASNCNLPVIASIEQRFLNGIDRTISDLLLSPATSLAELTGLKNWSKRQSAVNDNAIPREVLGAIYFAAICAARLHHGTRLTHLSDAALAHSLVNLRECDWIPQELRQLYQDGLACLPQADRRSVGIRDEGD